MTSYIAPIHGDRGRGKGENCSDKIISWEIASISLGIEKKGHQFLVIIKVFLFFFQSIENGCSIINEDCAINDRCKTVLLPLLPGGGDQINGSISPYCHRAKKGLGREREREREREKYFFFLSFFRWVICGYCRSQIRKNGVR